MAAPDLPGPWAHPTPGSQFSREPPGTALTKVLGLLVGVMPYQGCSDLGVDSGGVGTGPGAGLGAAGASSSSSNGLYGLGSGPCGAASSTPPFSTCLPSWPGGGPGLLLGGRGAGFFFGSACTSVIQGASFLGAGVLDGGQEEVEHISRQGGAASFSPQTVRPTAGG